MIPQSGPFWLRDERVAALVVASLHYLDGKRYTLNAFCVMPNPVHLVCTPLLKSDDTYHALSVIMHSLKRHTAFHANKILERKGDFWQHENYDHIVRDEAEYNRIVAYVLNNPASAGLVSSAQEWKWLYCSANL